MTGRRVLFVIHYPIFGGPHNRALLLAEPLRQRGWDLELLLPDEPGNAAERFEDVGIRVERLPLARMRAVPNPGTHVAFVRKFRDDVNRIRGLIRERHYEMVVIGGLVNPQAAVAARLENVAIVWQILDTRAPGALRVLLAPIVLDLADVVMTTGVRVAELHPGLDRLKERLIAFYGPVDSTAFHSDHDRRRRARAELGFSEDAVVVGTVGNLSPMKRHADFITAAAAVNSSHPAVRFAILGAAYDYRQGYTESLLRLVDALGLGSRLVIRDPEDRVADLAAAFDIFWLSSGRKSEGVPTVVGEAMMLGLPVVTTRAGGVADAVEDGVTGFIVPPGEPLALAEATRPLLDDPALRAAFGEAGRARGERLFGLESGVTTHDRAFEIAAAHNRIRLASMLKQQSNDETDDEKDIVRAAFVCPRCREGLDWASEAASCTACESAYPIRDGIPIFHVAQGDPHKLQQATYFDDANAEFEISRPHGAPALYRWLIGEKFRRSARALGDAVSGRRVLVVCAGSGMDAEFLARAGATVVTADISLEACRRASKRALQYGLSIEPILADVENLPFADRSFDLVYVHDGLHHLENPLVGVREMARVAHVAVSVNEPVRAAATRLAVRVGFSYEVEDAGNRVERVDPNEIARALEDEGLRVVVNERYAMYYRHEPGVVFRTLSHEPLFTATRIALRGFNLVAGGIGNKSTIQAVRAPSAT